jgi:hypothetical protein
MMSKSNDKETIDSPVTDGQRFERLLSGIYGNASSTTRYKQIPRTHSFSEINEESKNDTKDARRITLASIHSQQDAAAKSIQNDTLNRKLMYSRHLSRSMGFLQAAEENQKKIVYNWSGLHEIARKTQIVRPKTVSQLIRHIRTATSKVSLTFEVCFDRI